MPGPQPERESRFPQFLHAYTKYYSWTENDLNFLDEKISDEVNSSFSSFHSPSLLAHAHYRLYLAPRRLSVGKDASFLSALLRCCRLRYVAHAQSLQQDFSPHMPASGTPLGIANGLTWHDSTTSPTSRGFLFTFSFWLVPPSHHLFLLWYNMNEEYIRGCAVPLFHVWLNFTRKLKAKHECLCGCQHIMPVQSC